MIKVEGKVGIAASIIAHSKSAVNGKEIITYELIYPRYIHAEFLTHRLFSRNSASSRAIPVSRMIELIKEKPATFVHWGKNQAGMQAKEENHTLVKYVEFPGKTREVTREEAWETAAGAATFWAERLNEAGYHKQIVNRLLEPFQMMKVVVTATEWDNFFHLRNHADAQPEIAELAKVMLEAKKQSVPVVLEPGEYHTPYVNFDVISRGYFLNNADGEQTWLTPEDAIKISCSCCAQVSYRKLDDSLEKALAIYDRLVTSEPVHASALEHCATPMDLPEARDPINECYDGATHIDRKGNVWSGNFQSWTQFRQTLTNHTCWAYNHG